MLYTNIYLISEQYIKQQSSVMQNVEQQFIDQHILEAQNIDMFNLLGEPLYDTLMEEWKRYKDELEGGTTTAPPEVYISERIYKLTMDYVRPMLLYFTLYYSMYDLYMKMTNKGTVEQSSQNSNNADTMLIEKQRKDFRNKGEVYATRMLEFLVGNTDYPEFQSGLDECGSATGNSAYTNPWYLGPA